VLTASNDLPPLDPFAALFPATVTAEVVENARKALEEERKELEERRKFQLEQDSERLLSSYHQQRIRHRIDKDVLPKHDAILHNIS
jgi:sRNA-binding protein